MLHKTTKTEYVGFENPATSEAHQPFLRTEETPMAPAKGTDVQFSDLVNSSIALGNASTQFVLGQFETAFKIMTWPIRSAMKMMPIPGMQASEPSVGRKV